MVYKIDEVNPARFQGELESLFKNGWRDLNKASEFWHDCAKKLSEMFESQNRDKKLNNSSSSFYPTTGNMIVLECSDSYQNCFEALRKIEETYAGKLRKSRSCSGKFRPRYENGIRFVFADKILAI